MPRSGTSWLGQIFDSSPEVRFRLSPLFSYEFKNHVNEQSTREEWEHVFQGAYASSNAFMNQTERRSAGEYPVFPVKQAKPRCLVIKETRFHNLLERALDLIPNLKAVAIIRHPCGAIHSWLTAPREFPRNLNPLVEWRSGACRKTSSGEFWGFDDWKTVTRLHLRLSSTMPQRFALQRYEDVVRDPVSATRRLFSFCGLDYTSQTENFIRDSQSKHVDNEYAVFKDPSVKDRWRTELTLEIRDSILRDITGSDLGQFL